MRFYFCRSLLLETFRVWQQTMWETAWDWCLWGGEEKKAKGGILSCWPSKWWHKSHITARPIFSCHSNSIRTVSVPWYLIWISLLWTRGKTERCRWMRADGSANGPVAAYGPTLSRQWCHSNRCVQQRWPASCDSHVRGSYTLSERTAALSERWNSPQKPEMSPL